ncbi:unnamed protein product [Darwinula stevensoni]|uniref:Uncharacterized protein n=1 Tax=Darwinula stevensoni TaxID=69355 RepID=A0A7R8XCU5_9CRUS|nr:unnamed protein product [Darwinula stevensoni]CAG0894084.1 unnamed protein product [Darwinula stevensoni]
MTKRTSREKVEGVEESALGCCAHREERVPGSDETAPQSSPGPPSASRLEGGHCSSLRKERTGCHPDSPAIRERPEPRPYQEIPCCPAFGPQAPFASKPGEQKGLDATQIRRRFENGRNHGRTKRFRVALLLTPRLRSQAAILLALWAVVGGTRSRGYDDARLARRSYGDGNPRNRYANIGNPYSVENDYSRYDITSMGLR